MKRNKDVRIISLRMKMILGFVLVGIVSSLAVGLVTYKVISDNEYRKIQEKLSMIAQVGASIIDEEAHAKLQPGDESEDEYIALVSRLREFKRISGLTYLYTFVPYNEEKVKFVLDTDESEDAAGIGDEYDQDEEIKAAFNGEVKVTDKPYTDEWGTFFSGFAPVRNAEGKVTAIVGADISLDDVRSIQARLQMFILLGILSSMVLSFAAALLFSYLIGRPVKQLVHKLDDVVRNSGDLTQTIRIRTGDELESLADKTTQFINNIRDIIRIIRATAVNANQTAEEISKAVTNTAAASETVSHAMEEIAAGAGKQAGAVHESTERMEQLAGHIDVLSRNSDRINGQANVARQYADQCSQAMNELKENFKTSEEIAADVSGTVSRLEVQSGEIVKIIEVITSISSQTNLLALNAAIEAARAGEQGKGFAVVADEIRKLAESTTVSAREIARHIHDIRNQSTETSLAMGKVVDTISSQAASIDKTNAVLGGIVSVVDGISSNLAEVNRAVEDIFSRKEAVMGDINHIYSTSENMVSATEEVNAAAEEQHAVIDSISEKMAQLKVMASELEQAVSRFRI